MKFSRIGLLAPALALLGASAGALSTAAPSGAAGSTSPWQGACAPASRGHVTCLVEIVHHRSSGVTPSASTGIREQVTPSGYGPQTVAKAYGFSTSGGSGETVAIVDAYGDPTITANLQSFDTQYGLPTCSTANGCFKKVNQTGGSTYPASTPTGGWELETSLDVEWVHALAPNAHVLLVESTTASTANIFAAVSYAAAHAQYVSMSWGGTQSSTESSLDSYFTASGVSFFAASGDTGASVIYPASSPDVVAVGGTTLNVTGTGTWSSESSWSTAGGGCSAYETAAGAQAAYPTYGQATANCNGKRAIPDISLDANPTTGVAVYDTARYCTFISCGSLGWIQVGGTSASTAMVAGHAAETAQLVNASYVYGSSIKTYDVTAGVVRTPYVGTPSHPCETGYDLCTGRGSWNTAVGTTSAPPLGSLVFTSTAKSATAASPVGLTLHTSAAPASAFGATLSTSSAGGDFSLSTAGPFTHTLQVTVPTTGHVAVYYEDTKAGTPTLSASASRWTSATRTITVTPGTLARITVSPATAKVAAGKTQAFTATGYDGYANPVTTGFSPTWSTTAPGSVTPKAGTATTFTAGASAGSGLVTATQGAVSKSANVTVTTAPSLSVALTPGSVIKRSGTYYDQLTAKVTSSGKVVSRASVVFDVYSGTSCTGTPVAKSSALLTSSTGVARYTFSTRILGTFCALATATKSGFTGGSATATFAT